VWREGALTHADLIGQHLGMQAVYSATRMPDPERGSGADQLGMAVLGRWPEPLTYGGAAQGGR
jgi:hypothetical protein